MNHYFWEDELLNTRADNSQRKRGTANVIREGTFPEISHRCTFFFHVFDEI
jgi:hypothetical protein